VPGPGRRGRAGAACGGAGCCHRYQEPGEPRRAPLDAAAALHPPTSVTATRDGVVSPYAALLSPARQYAPTAPPRATRSGPYHVRSAVMDEKSGAVMGIEHINERAAPGEGRTWRGPRREPAVPQEGRPYREGR